jgi:hypothetical protein
VNYSESGKEFRSAPSDDLDTPDPPHEIPYVNISLEGERHDGFVKAYLTGGKKRKKKRKGIKSYKKNIPFYYLSRYEKYHKVVGDQITDADLLG